MSYFEKTFLCENKCHASEENVEPSSSGNKIFGALQMRFSSCVFQKRNCFLLIHVKCQITHHVMFTLVACVFMCCHGDRVHNNVCAVHEVATSQCQQQG